ncbi:MAG: MBL fold metallo-hydrolase [Nitrosomonas sp.]|nr:MBL fold metallo-hydrolase [Nitrosomonas sp.]MBK7365893.1 MBL fold metallo-hydrolase [Nitrosomonas sp.]
MNANIKAFFDPTTWTMSYVVYDERGGFCAIIDPVLDYDPKSGRTKTVSADKLIDFVQESQLTVEWLLETHAHADHLSAAAYLQDKVGGRTAIGESITLVQGSFKKLFNLSPEFVADGLHFNHRITDGEVLRVGKITLKAISVPGHTPADMAYQLDDAVFVGDTLFMPDVGTARADFPGGDAHQLYHSIQKILSLPPQTRLFMCHDYPPSNRSPQWESTVFEEKMHNIHIKDGVTEDAFVAMRTKRDATLEIPVLMLPSVQVNIRAGRFPDPESNGVSYLKIPINAI